MFVRRQLLVGFAAIAGIAGSADAAMLSRVKRKGKAAKSLVAPPLVGNDATDYLFWLSSRQVNGNDVILTSNKVDGTYKAITSNQFNIPADIPEGERTIKSIGTRKDRSKRTRIEFTFENKYATTTTNFDLKAWIAHRIRVFDFGAPSGKKSMIKKYDNVVRELDAVRYLSVAQARVLLFGLGNSEFHVPAADLVSFVCLESLRYDLSRYIDSQRQGESSAEHAVSPLTPDDFSAMTRATAILSMGRELSSVRRSLNGMELNRILEEEILSAVSLPVMIENQIKDLETKKAKHGPEYIDVGYASRQRAQKREPKTIAGRLADAQQTLVDAEAKKVEAEEILRQRLLSKTKIGENVRDWEEDDRIWELEEKQRGSAEIGTTRVFRMLGG